MQPTRLPKHQNVQRRSELRDKQASEHMHQTLIATKCLLSDDRERRDKSYKKKYEFVSDIWRLPGGSFKLAGCRLCSLCLRLVTTASKPAP
jgi:hypothetical protein